jgi:hypothetical protein
MWNPFGLHVVDKLSTRAKMNSDCFTTNIRAPLELTMFPAGTRPHARRLTLHLENWSMRMSRASEVFIIQHPMGRLTHPPDLSGLAPSNSHLFPTVTEGLKNFETVDDEGLFDRLKELLNGIAPKKCRSNNPGLMSLNVSSGVDLSRRPGLIPIQI